MQLNESEHRIFKMESEKKMLQERNDKLYADLEDIKKKMDSRVSVDYYLYTIIN